MRLRWILLFFKRGGAAKAVRRQKRHARKSGSSRLEMAARILKARWEREIDRMGSWGDSRNCGLRHALVSYP